MGVAEALVLLLLGLLAGVSATIFDVLVSGAASFLMHYTLWVLLNALLAVHVGDRVKAVWWAIPFNFGFIESYYIGTSASYEGFPRSLVVTLVVVALISPLLTYAMWTAKNERNAYGRILSILIVAGTLASGYLVDRHLGIYDIVVSVLVGYVLLFMHARRLSIAPSSHPQELAEELGVLDGDALVQGIPQKAPKPKRKAKRTRFGFGEKKRKKDKPLPVEDKRNREDNRRREPSRNRKDDRRREDSRNREGARANVYESPQPQPRRTTKRNHEPQDATSSKAKRTLRPTRRKRSDLAAQRDAASVARRRRNARAQEERGREERRRASAQRRASARDDYARNDAPPSTLGNARVARRSTREY